MHIQTSRHYNNELEVYSFVAEFKNHNNLTPTDIVGFYAIPHTVMNGILRYLGVDKEVVDSPQHIYDSNLRVLEDIRRPNNNLFGKQANRAITWIRPRQKQPVVQSIFSTFRETATDQLPATIYLFGKQALSDFLQEFEVNI